MPLCSDCRSEAEFTTTSKSEDGVCSRCGGRCDNCNGFTSTNATAPTGSMPPPLPDGPAVAFVAGVALTLILVGFFLAVLVL